MKEELEGLKKFIEANAKQNGQEAWFYPKYNRVKGFFGTQDIILLGLNPSSGIFPSEKDILFYDLLKKKGLANVHITDLIKIRAKNKEVEELLSDKKLMKKQIRFFEVELFLIKPKIIITIGLQCNNLLKQYFPKIDSTYIIKNIKHYSFRYQKRE